MTMRPNQFEMNSDYLSIAQIDTSTYDVYIPQGTLVYAAYTEQNFDFTTKPQKGAVDRIMIKKDNGPFCVGPMMSLIPTWDPNWNNNVSGYISVFRTSATNIRIQVILENFGNGTSTYPAISFKISVASFKPPNVF